MTTRSSSFLQRPHSCWGWWAVGLMAASILLNIINTAIFMQRTTEAAWQQTILPFYGIFMLLCGLSAGGVGLIALIRMRDRSWLVWLTILPGISTLLFILGEFLLPH